VKEDGSGKELDTVICVVIVVTLIVGMESKLRILRWISMKMEDASFRIRKLKSV
jgi:hypothetical protein